jgi:response regulator RpfG family c-di-GMP phosphodiesterase
MANDNKDLNDFFKKYEKEEPEELKQYIEDINQGVDPNKQTALDKLAGFFRNLAIRTGLYYKKVEKPEISEKPSDFRRKARIVYKRVTKRLFDRFNFEAGINILDDVQVLYKRNKVNRSILLITNFVLILFTLIGNQSPKVLVIIMFAIIMFIVSISMKNMIEEEPRTLIKQQMAMYFGGVYILLASVGVYIKLVFSARTFVPVDGMTSEALITMYQTALTDNSIAQAGYILIYFALVVIALYQDPTMLRILFKWVLGIMTLIHLGVMYNDVLWSIPGGIEGFIKFLFSPEHINIVIDIVLRTIVLVIFSIALYSSVSIGNMMNKKRREELIKRRDMEKDFTAVVADVFDVIAVFNSHTINQNKESVHRIAEIASRLGNVLGLSSNVCTEIYDYSVIHIDKVDDLSILEYENKEQLTERDYVVIREKTILGSIIIKRLQLNQKSEDIIRAHFEKTNDSDFTERMKRVQRSQEGQIILLAEMYDVLRQSRNYKNKLKHRKAMDMLNSDFKEYFEPYILDRFLKYEDDFESVYEKYKFFKGLE